MSMRPRDKAGASGIFRFVRHSTKGMKGSGPNGEVTFQDLFHCDKHGLGIRDDKGRIQPKHPERVRQDIEVRNKFTRRGLAYMMHTALKNHGGTYAPPEVTYDPTISPFNAFMLLADESASGIAADQKVTWDESDGQYDANIPASNAVAGEGKRGLLFSETSNTYLRRIYTRYPTTNPYRELEYVFYAQANTAPLVSGDNNYIDNFPIKAICIAAGEACGYNEANSQIGIRAILGVPPIHQGISDRVYVHEHGGTPGHKYLATETLGTYGDGWLESSDDGTNVGSNCFDGDVADEAVNGVPDWGGKWVSVDTGGPHKVGRIWASAKTIRGVRVVLPPGVNSNFAPNNFEFQYLDPAKAPGGDPNNLIPEDDSHWTLLQAVSGDGINIYDTADRGKEYDFGAEYTCYGIRMAGIESVDDTRKVEIAELLCYEEMDPVEITSVLANNVLRIRTDGATWRDFTIQDVGPVILVDDIVTELNRQLRGYELQAVRSDFGFLWIRGTVAGSNSTVEIDSETNGSVINTPLGLPVGGQSKTGLTQSVTKAFDDALTITYRVAISGDLPV